jgi:hypothetical protein
MRFEPAKAGGSAVARFTGSVAFLLLNPGACAPGFMLPPASQVQRAGICDTCFAGSAPTRIAMLHRFSAHAFARLLRTLEPLPSLRKQDQLAFLCRL